MKAVIIAGGLGTRLRPLTYNTPKPIVPMANRPFVLHQIELLRKHGIKEIILNLHYLLDNIRKILEDGKKLGVKIHYSIEEVPLGTAGAVKNAEGFFDEEPIVVFNGDIVTDINISQVVKSHYQNKARATLTLTRVEDPTAYGLIITDKKGMVTHFVEKPSWEQVANYSVMGSADTINAGIYVLDPKIFKGVPPRVEYSFERQLFPSLLEQGDPIYGYVSDRYWIDIGNPSQYRQAHEAIMRDQVSFKIPGKQAGGKIWIGDDTRIAKTAKLLGPVIIGKKAIISSQVQLKDYTVLGDETRVGPGTVIEHSIIWSGTKIGSHASLKGCIIGFNCLIEDFAQVGEGVVLADGSVVRKGSILNA